MKILSIGQRPFPHDLTACQRRRDDEHDYLRWCFADLATAEAFAAQFGGEVLQVSRPHC
jgi:hypothetical protein